MNAVENKQAPSDLSGGVGLGKPNSWRCANIGIVPPQRNAFFRNSADFPDFPENPPKI
jgi:hypothetical protein